MTRPLTVCLRPGVLPAVELGVIGGFRRKSVRMSLSSGRGSEILPKEEPERRRSVECADGLRAWPKQQTPSSAKKIPRASPGKNPARTAVAGNLLQLCVTGIKVVEGEEVVVGFALEEADGVLVAEVVGLVLDPVIGETL